MMSPGPLTAAVGSGLPRARGSDSMQGATRRKLERLRAALHTSMMRCALAHWQAAALATGPYGYDNWSCTGNLTINDLLEEDRLKRYSSPGGRRRALKIMKRLQWVRTHQPARSRST